MKLAVIAALAVLTAAISAAARPLASGGSVSITLDPVAGASAKGAATLVAGGSGTSVQLAMSGLPPGGVALVRLHAGACSELDRLSASFAFLVRLSADASGRARATARVRFRGAEEVPLSRLTDGGHVIVVVVGDRIVACGTIPRRDLSRIKVGRAIGAVAIGMTRSDVLRAFGRPRGEAVFTFPNGKPGRTARYREHGAPFLVIFSRGDVVWLEASSRYYRTDNGVGVGSPIRAAARLAGFERDLCEGGYSRRAYGTLTSFIPRNGVVARVRIVKTTFFDC